MGASPGDLLEEVREISMYRDVVHIGLKSSVVPLDVWRLLFEHQTVGEQLPVAPRKSAGIAVDKNLIFIPNVIGDRQEVAAIGGKTCGEELSSLAEFGKPCINDRGIGE